MARVYANLLGVWTDLSSDPDCVIGNNRQSPSTWWEEGADMCIQELKPMKTLCINGLM